MSEPNDASFSSSNDEFQKFLDEPLSTTESEKSNVHIQETITKRPLCSSNVVPAEYIPPVETNKTVDVPKVTGHGWLKKPKSALGLTSGITAIEAAPSETNEIFTSEKDVLPFTDLVEPQKTSYRIDPLDTESVSDGKSDSQVSSALKDGKASSERENSGSEYSSMFESEDEETVKDETQRDENAPHDKNEKSIISDKKNSQDSQASGEHLLGRGETVASDVTRAKGNVLEFEALKDNVPVSSNEAEGRDLSFLEMVMHSDEAENKIIQELSIEKQELPDIQESSESSESLKQFNFLLDQENAKRVVPSVEENQLDVNNINKDVKRTLIPSDTIIQTRKKDAIADRETSKKKVTSIPTPVKHVTSGKSVSFTSGAVSASERKLEKETEDLRKEIEEQNELIRGYQRENEKLYSEMKHLKKSTHISETKWRIETEKLRMEVGKLREQAKSLDLDWRNAKKPKRKEADRYEYSSAFKELKDEAEMEKMKLKNLEVKMLDFQNRIRELSTENEASSKTKLELMEKNTSLQGQLREMENICAKWKFEVEETKLKEQENKIVTVHQEQQINRHLESDRLQMQVKNLLQELNEKDANTKTALEELRQQYNLLRQKYQKHLEETEKVEIKKKDEMSSKLEKLQNQLQETEKKLEESRSAHDPSRYRTVAVQVHNPLSVDLENKEMKLKLERLTLQLEDLELKYEQLRSSKLQQCVTTRPEIIHKIPLEERRHSSNIVLLHNKVENLEILTNHLSILLKESEQKHHYLENENSNFKKTIEDLNEEMLTTQKNQSLEGKTFFQIERKISDLQTWHRRREMTLREAMAKSRCNCSVELQSEVTRWQRRVIEKNREIDSYRRELDIVTEYLRQLQS